MKNVATTTVRKIKVQLNTNSKRRDQWARIHDAATNEVLHTGQVSYIKRVAKKKYNRKISV